jgi:hypothetical protein
MFYKHRKDTPIWKNIEIETMGENWIISAYCFQSMLIACLMTLRSFDKYEKHENLFHGKLMLDIKMSIDSLWPFY